MAPGSLSAEVTRRVSFLRTMFDSNRETPQKFVIAEFKKKFDHGISFVALKQLREAHSKGKFSDVAVPLFTRSVQRLIAGGSKKKASKKTAKKTAKKAAKKTTKKAAKKVVKKAAPKAAAKPAATKVAKKASKKKVRGERREKVVRRGRRAIDKRFVDVSDTSNHLVLITIEGGVTPHHFKGKKDAQAFINASINSGVSPSKVTYFQRADINYKIQL